MENSTLFALLQNSQIVVSLYQKQDSDTGDFSSPRKSNIYPYISKTSSSDISLRIYKDYFF